MADNEETPMVEANVANGDCKEQKLRECTERVEKNFENMRSLLENAQQLMNIHDDMTTSALAALPTLLKKEIIEVAQTVIEVLSVCNPDDPQESLCKMLDDFSKTK